MFFRDDDWGAQYSFVPSNTLLEPNNVIPSWEFGDEENKEVSATLRRIRQKYDNIHKTVLAKEKELELIKVSSIPVSSLPLYLFLRSFSANWSKPRTRRARSRTKSTARPMDSRTRRISLMGSRTPMPTR